MPPRVSGKRRRPDKGQDEDARDDQSRLVGFKTSIVRAIVDPASKRQDQRATRGSEGDPELSKALSDFDWNHSFGPCSEISRSQRLARAKKFGLHVEDRIERAIDDRSHGFGSEVSVSSVDRLMRHYVN
ncbi:hypothetical protein OJ253_2908 [Cryptosporidium canis]|uniref:Uncharacterized protein n=1 Tax=Cryptosporidium canis TaxID=195482 RepID=A0A9D5HXS1_9CRYT|nr:hypothetical protein OJ253_2908 [Cryptosporidium canis]